MQQNYNVRTLWIVGILAGSIVWLANNGNPMNARTGAPFDGNCNSCHDGNNPGGFDGTITLSGISGPIQPNTTYPLLLEVTPTAGSPVKAGFQLVVVDANNANCGDLTPGNAQTGTEFSGGREYIDHRGGKNFPGGGAPVSWNFNWKSPVSVAGNTVKFYYIANFCNGNTNDSGDHPIWTNESFTFEGLPPVVATITDITHAICNGSNTGSATAEGSGGSGSYTYAWSNGQNTQTAVNLAAGTYTVTVTGSGGSGTATATATITQPPPITLSASTSGIISCVNQSVTVTATAGGGTGPFTFEWSNGASGNPIDVTLAGSYIVTATDNSGCTKTATVTVNANTIPPNAVANSPDTLSCLQTTIQLNGAGSSSGANFTYQWTTTDGNIVSGANTLFPVVNDCGTYTLIVTNTTNGCTSTASTTTPCNFNNPTIIATGGALTCIQSTVQLTASSNAGSPVYSWAGPNGYTSTQQNPVVTQDGVYTVTVINNDNGCTASTTTTVTVNTALPTAVIAPPAILTCSVTSLALNGTGSSSGNNFTYLWTTVGGNIVSGSTTLSPIIDECGTYTLRVTDTQNGCTQTAIVTVNCDFTIPSVSASGGVLTCQQTSVQLNATTNGNPATYLWNGPNGYTSSVQNPVVTANGTYTVTVTNTVNGCTASTTTSVSLNNTAPSSVATAGTITCADSIAALSATTNATQATFAWSGPNGFVSTQQNTSTGITGTYTVVVTDQGNGCTSTASAAVNLNTIAPLASATVPGNLNCNNSSLQLNGSGSSQGSNFAYLWTTTNGQIVSGENTLTPIVDAVGTYTLLVTNTSNGCTADSSVAVLQTPAVEANIGLSENVSCNGSADGIASITPGGGTGAYTFMWSNSATNDTITGLAAGTYNVTVTDSDNCTATASVSISQPPVLTVNAVATGETSQGANDGAATASPAGGTAPYTYLWSNNQTSATITNLAPGNYMVTVTDDNNCTSVQTVTVNSFNCALTTAIQAANISCNGANNGTANIQISGAAEPVTYLWSNGATTQNVGGLAPGVYTVQINDANNCPATLSVSISEPPALSVNATATGETVLNGNDGTASAQPIGGTMPYTYQWSNNATTATITNLSPGSYTVSVSDVNNCISVQTVIVSPFDCALQSNITTVNALCFGAANGQATIFLNGGNLPYTYLWSNGNASATASNLPAGVHTVTATDASGCTTIQTVSIGQPDALQVGIEVQNVECLADQTGAAAVNISGGTPAYNFAFSDGSAGQNLGVGNYNVSVTDANGCLATQNFSIVSTDSVAPVLICPTDLTACEGAPVVYTQPFVTDNCDIKGIEITLSGGLPSGSIFPLGETILSIEAKDISGNTSVCSFKVTVTPNPVPGIDQVLNDAEGAGVGSIQVSISSGTAPYVFFWSKENVFFSDQEDLTGLFAGAYTLIVSDANGCEAQLDPVIIDNIVSAEEPYAFTIKIWPNPARTLLHIASDERVSAAQILDVHGRLVQEITDSELSTGVIAMGHLPEGMYFLQMLLRDKWQTVKWIKAD